MLKHLVYVASPSQAQAVRTALDHLKAKPLQESHPAGEGFFIQHPLLDGITLNLYLLTSLADITPHLRHYPVDLLVYDERGEGGIEVRAALARIRDDVAAFAHLWGPDFLFPMSRVVAILNNENNSKNEAHRAFELGRVHVRDVCIAPKNTAVVLRWLHSILTRDHRPARVGVALSGGGIEGFLFQVGVLYALERALVHRNLRTSEVFSGVSSGSICAAILASNVPVLEVIKALHGKSAILKPLSSSTIFDLASRQILGRITKNSTIWPSLSPRKWIDQTLSSIPTGFFKGEELRNYFEHCIESFGGSNSFKDLSSELYIGATDQDSYEHVVFGEASWEDVPITEAIRASCALPPVFIPVQLKGRWFIDGQITRTCNLELVVERDCSLIVIIDPLRPVSTAVPGSVDKKGGIFALIQAVKALVYTRFHSTLSHLTERYPDTDFLVFQPGEECAQLMSGSPMRYRIRTQVVHLAYQQTMRQLKERHRVYMTKLHKYGIELASVDQLKEIEREDNTLFESLAESNPSQAV